MTGLLQDLRYAARSLRRSPGLAAVAIVTLGLGIGASIAVFSVIDVAFYRPLPLGGEDRLVRLRDSLRTADGRLQESNTAAESFEAIRDRNRAFESVAAFAYGSASMPDGDASDRLSVVGTTSALRDSLGVRAVRGRDFSARELAAGRDSRVALISHVLFERLGSPDLGSAPSVLLDGVPHTIVGVLPRGFHFPYDADVWVPSRMAAGSEPAVFARRRPGVSLREANADLAAIAAGIRRERPQVGPGFGMVAMDARKSLIGDEGQIALGLLVLVGSLFLLTSADVASLLLARAVSRQGERALRSALGASRLRLLGAAAAEALLLASAASLVGLLACALVQEPLATLVPDNLRHQLGLARPSLDPRTLLFGLLAVIAAAALCTLLPAWRGPKASGEELLREAGRGTLSSRTEGSALNALVAAEIALALALVFGAALFARQLRRLERRDLGLRTRDVLSMQIALPGRMASAAERSAGVDAILAGARSIPGVSAAGVSTVNPLAGGTWVTPIDVEGHAPPDSASRYLANFRLVSPGLLTALGIPIVEGRAFEDSDRAGARPVAVVSRSLARRHWPGASALGRRIGMPGGASREIVGIAADVADAGEVADAWYVPYAQGAAVDGADEVYLMIRATPGTEAGRLARPVRSALARVDSRLAGYHVATLETVRSEVLARQRFGALLVEVLAGLGALVALLGSYGVTAYRVSRRRRDIGLRIALGAGPLRTVRDGLWTGLRPVAAGAAIGMALALAEGAALARLIPGIESFHAPTAAAVTAALIASAAAGLLLPALRAARQDPAVALRELR